MLSVRCAAIIGIVAGVFDLFDDGFKHVVGVPRLVKTGVVGGEVMKCDFPIVEEEMGKKFAERDVGEAIVRVAESAKISCREGICELFLESGVHVGVLFVSARVFRTSSPVTAADELAGMTGRASGQGGMTNAVRSMVA